MAKRKGKPEVLSDGDVEEITRRALADMESALGKEDARLKGRPSG